MQPEGTPFQRQVWQALLAHEGHRYLSRAARARRVSTTQMELPLGAA
ncbi:methylated-DNA--protein-cysteine methyltransferase [Bordetella pertussis]|nr:methylated-DNA--protein-cysteine methyltransferase [Bordetella pertussis]